MNIKEKINITDLLKETEKAWLLKLKPTTGTKQRILWFPKSVCKLKGKVLTIPSWLWIKKQSEESVIEKQEA
jgi:hypothetical protein